MHFGMTGWMNIRDEETAYYKPSQPEKSDEWPPKFWKFALETAEEPKSEAAFFDKRRLARIRLIDCPAEDIRKVSPLVKNGPDPIIDKEILTEEWLGKKLASKRVPIKALLLDQANISGIGNWVGDEVLYNSHIHPEQYSNTLSLAQVKQLHKSIQHVCGFAVDNLADSSKFPEDWLFKHRWGKGKKDSATKLPNGAKLVFLTVGGRTSCVVPSVQKKTGPVAKDVEDDGSDGEAETKPAKRKRASKVNDRKQTVKEETEPVENGVANGEEADEKPSKPASKKRKSDVKAETNGMDAGSKKPKRKAEPRENRVKVEAKEETTGRRKSTRHLVRARFDPNLRKAMDVVTKSRSLFDVALQSDQKVILSAVEKYVRNIAEDVRDVGNTVNENGKRLLDMDEHQARNHKEAISWHDETENSIKETGDSLLEYNRDWRNEIERKSISQETQNMLKWLSPLNFWTKHDDAFSRRYEGAGEWLLETNQFKSWVNGTMRTLLCLGISGAGKTIPRSVVLSHLERLHCAQNTALVMIYFTYKEQQEQSLGNLFGSILQQLLHKTQGIPEELSKLYGEYSQKNKYLSASECLKWIKSLIPKFSQLIVVIDALDECSEVDDTRDAVLTAMLSLQPTVQIFLTSRHIASIKASISNTEPLEIRAIVSDMTRYLEARLLKEKRLLRGLRNLPAEISTTYDDPIDRISNQNSEDARMAFRILSWITHARRVLQVDELGYALAIESTASNFDDENLVVQELLVSLCAGLVILEEQSGYIKLVHYTAQEYFEQTREKLFPTARLEIAKACLAYLSYDEVRICRSLSRPLFDSQGYFFAYWDDHVRSTPEDTIHDLAIRFLSQDEKVNRCVKSRFNVMGHFLFIEFRTTGLAMASAMGLYGVAKSSILSGKDVKANITQNSNWSGSRIAGGTALHNAA
ncbi:hypothetical protein OEA41_007638 [Lepraria neglecta]|uniref:Formamidopyrimidine-DNA glycosylase H2TH DNA-binding domain-containing protein n=1 Tax=Lepraria neglecta TaxID=209136 RepID=A0AAD9ZDY3_9LECA|nr:hypothetical protein OEA41_007638 [Lepraria neglecta]